MRKSLQQNISKRLSSSSTSSTTTRWYHTTTESTETQKQDLPCEQWLNSNNTARSLVGLTNLGNTCYMNSQLQSLACLSDLVNYFISNQYSSHLSSKSPSRGQIAKAFSTTIKALSRGKKNSVFSPRAIKSAVADTAISFSGCGQHDSQEWLRVLVSGLHDDVNRIDSVPKYVPIEESVEDCDIELSQRWWMNYTQRNQSFLSSMFCGQLSSKVTCLSCQYISRAYDPCWDISLPIARSIEKSGHSNSTTLQACFEQFTTIEKLSGQNQYFCSNCKTHRDASKKLSIARLPPVLVIHLKRFSFSSFSRKKISTLVEFPLQDLDISCFIAEGFTDEFNNQSSLYDLIAVSNHFGSTNGGHYTAYGRINRDTNSWTEFNDTSVRKLNVNHIQSSAAYVLFYERRHE